MTDLTKIALGTVVLTAMQQADLAQKERIALAMMTDAQQAKYHSLKRQEQRRAKQQVQERFKVIGVSLLVGFAIIAILIHL